jgi:peptide/nickel transport system ATP-binding protein
MTEALIQDVKADAVKMENIKTRFFTSRGIVKAIDDLSFEIKVGEKYGLVGESGSGKSVTATSVMDLIPDPPGRIIRGKVFIDGFNILTDLPKLVKINVRSETDVRVKRNKRAIKKHNYILSGIRGKKVSMIFQEPFLSLNPVLTIGDQIEEAILLHSRVSIADSLIKRETLSQKQIESIVDSLISQPDIPTRKDLIHNWCTENGVPDLESKFNDLIENSSDREFIVREAVQLALGEKEGLLLDDLYLAREYYAIQDKLHDLNLEYLNYEAHGNEAKANETLSMIKDLEVKLRTEFFSYRLRLKLFRKKYDKPFVKVAARRSLELLRQVNIAGAERVLDSYPHELSGGMLQRAMIAMSLSSNPRVLIADEPTTALDVTTQAQILDLIKDVNQRNQTSVLFITHDLAVIAEMCDRVGVMYGGNLVEEANVADIFRDAKHPYTTGLLNAIPRAERRFEKSARLESIPGSVPNLISPPSGCRFHPRCKFRMDVCSEKKPKLIEIEKDHKVACFLYSDEYEEVKEEDVP